METDKWLEQGIALVVEYAPKIVMAILIWIIGSIIFSRVVKYARKIMERRNYEISLREFLGTLLYWALKILLIIVILPPDSIISIELPIIPSVSLVTVIITPFDFAFWVYKIVGSN